MVRIFDLTSFGSFGLIPIFIQISNYTRLAADMRERFVRMIIDGSKLDYCNSLFSLAQHRTI